VLWASFSSGGLHELRQINPQYAHPNKSVAYLLSKLHYSPSNGYWDSYHVGQCSLYMPNWTKAERCVRARIMCESKLPQQKDTFGNGEHGDVFADAFRKCWLDTRPFMGPAEWLRASRGLWRVGVFLGAVWITGGGGRQVEDASKWGNKNLRWLTLLEEWVQEGD
jgi:hypothetical protein